jgi:uncharacterized protein (DUF58 family)
MPFEQKQLLLKVRGRPVTFIPGKKSLSRLPGDWSSPFSGQGYEPMGYRDFALGDDPRRINLAATARRGQPTIVERIALREFNILIVIDASGSMRVREKWEIQMAAATLLLYSAWKAETSFGIAVSHGADVVSFGIGLGSRHFHRLQRTLGQMISAKSDSLPNGRRLPLSRCLPVNSMMLFCSDFLDTNGRMRSSNHLAHAIRRYDFVPIVIQDELECSFPAIKTRTVVPLKNPETGAERDTWLSPEIAVSIKNAHEHRFRELVRMFLEKDVHAIHLKSPNIASMSNRIDAYFRRRIGT